MDDFPIEGDLIEDLEGNFYEIKDFHQPRDRVIGFLRYGVLNPTQKLVSINNLNNIFREIHGTHSKKKYVKLYDFADKMRFMKQNYPDRIYQFSNIYFPVQIISFDIIQKHYRPEIFVQENLKNASQLDKNSPLYHSIQLISMLSEKSQVPTTFFGITGSTLIGLATSNSDIDLIVYGYAQSLKVRSTLRQMFQDTENNPLIRKYNLEELENLYNHRTNHKTPSLYKFISYETRKLHQGWYNSRDYFIRFFINDKRTDYRKENHFSNRDIIKMGRIMLSAQVIDDYYWWTTPSIIRFANASNIEFLPESDESFQKLAEHHLSVNEVTQTFSLRGRFTENVRLLEFFTISGTLELVIPQNDESFLQISLGTNNEDFLYPK